MKRLMMLTGGLLMAGALATAEFAIPKKAYRVSQFEEAKAEAAAAGKPITVILSDATTSCPLACDASTAVFNTLGRKTVIVYVGRGGAEWQALPGLLKEAFQKPEAGTFIPKTVIVDPEVSRVIAFVPYGNPGEMNKALSKAKKTIAHTFIPGSGSRSGAARSSRSAGTKSKPASPASVPEE